MVAHAAHGVVAVQAAQHRALLWRAGVTASHQREWRSEQRDDQKSRLDPLKHFQIMRFHAGTFGGLDSCRNGHANAAAIC